MRACVLNTMMVLTMMNGIDGMNMDKEVWNPGDAVIERRINHATGRKSYGARDAVGKVHKTGRMTLSNAGSEQFIAVTGGLRSARKSGGIVWSSPPLWVRLTPEVEADIVAVEARNVQGKVIQEAAEALSAYVRLVRYEDVLDPEILTLAEALNRRFDEREKSVPETK